MVNYKAVLTGILTLAWLGILIALIVNVVMIANTPSIDIAKLVIIGVIALLWGFLGPVGFVKIIRALGVPVQASPK